MSLLFQELDILTGKINIIGMVFKEISYQEICKRSNVHGGGKWSEDQVLGCS